MTSPMEAFSSRIQRSFIYFDSNRFHSQQSGPTRYSNWIPKIFQQVESLTHRWIRIGFCKKRCTKLFYQILFAFCKGHSEKNFVGLHARCALHMPCFTDRDTCSSVQRMLFKIAKVSTEQILAKMNIFVCSMRYPLYSVYQLRGTNQIADNSGNKIK